MPRKLQDLVRGERGFGVIAECELAEGATIETAAIERLKDHMANPTSRIYGVRVVDCETDEELFLWTRDHERERCKGL
jgi:hypothetical protein